jgi:hypothetical protein
VTSARPVTRKSIAYNRPIICGIGLPNSSFFLGNASLGVASKEAYRWQMVFTLESQPVLLHFSIGSVTCLSIARPPLLLPVRICYSAQANRLEKAATTFISA